ncbi:MAG: phosphatase PAP2 family protein [Lachnospiraceae bacterium]|nr:phosphatase PAP2 family protein [Lachnospiraceae bacterium]
MDIAYLLWFQDFRNSIGDALTPFMQWVSDFAVDYLILFAIFYYWNCEKRGGLYTLVSYYFSIFITPFIKLTACIYRPWIRDSRIVPAGDAIRTATSYSFPSGHTTTAGPLAGGLAINTWKDRRTKGLSVLFVLFILLTMISRNYLGVHTPQDVCVGLLISILSLFLTAKLFNYLDRHPEKENMLLICGFIICCLGIAYITLKPYPMDYDAAGKLLVDPQKMMEDGYGDMGKMMGFIIARFVEKNWIGFEPLRNKSKSAILCVIFLLPLIPMKEYFRPVLVGAFGSHWGKLFFSIIYAFYYIALIPMILKILGRREQKA